MARAKKNFDTQEFEPIPKGQKAEWDDLITRSKAVVKTESGAQFKLVLLAAEVETKYGESTIKRWAEEIGIGYSSARHFRLLAKRGVDEAFIKRYGKLSYTVVRDIVFYCGGTSKAEYLLQYALKHNVGPTAINAFMRDMTAPPLHKEEAAAHKLAIRMKQQLEGSSELVKTMMEKAIEAHPELEDRIMEHKIMKVSDLEDLLVQAGVKTNDEQRIVDQAQRDIKRIRKDTTFYRNNTDELKASVEYSHEASAELRDRLKYLRDTIDEILKAQPQTKVIDEADAVVIDLGPKKKVKS